jgi:sugar lactone lactonase YvrE
MEIVNIAPERASLGESPVWSADEGALYWVDINGCRLHRADYPSLNVQSWDTPSPAGMIALRSQGGLMVAMVDGLYAFDPETEDWQLLVALETDQPDNRPNDGKCDAAGRLWVGTMNMADHMQPTGSFYRIDTDLSIEKIAGDIRIPNGLAWSPDDTAMYRTDTRSGVVWRYAFDAKAGTLGAETEFFGFDGREIGGVDGAAMDSGGGYWAALYGGSRVVRINGDGEIDRDIPLPAKQPTMPCFGGPEMKTLFVTSAAQNLDEAFLAAEPDNGGLLMVETDVTGHPVHSFGG